MLDLQDPSMRRALVVAATLVAQDGNYNPTFEGVLQIAGRFDGTSIRVRDVIKALEALESPFHTYTIVRKALEQHGILPAYYTGRNCAAVAVWDEHAPPGVGIGGRRMRRREVPLSDMPVLILRLLDAANAEEAIGALAE